MLAPDVDHAALFARAWSDPAYTAVELPPVDVHRYLDAHYDLPGPIVYGREELWAMEVAKAFRPDLYIPSVVRAGSLLTEPTDTPDHFLRVSEQREWLRPEHYVRVLEDVGVDHARQTVHFIGLPEVVLADGTTASAGREQPLFHVEHSVSGPAERPVNRWRIVHLTEAPDRRLVEHFAAAGRSPYLPEFVEIHLRDVLGHRIARRQPAHS